MRKIIHVLTIHAPREKVFKAIKSPQGLSNWWSTKVTGEDKVGGIIDFTFVTDFNPDMKITALHQPSEVRWTCVTGHDKWQDNKFSFELSDAKGETQLMFTQEYAGQISDEDFGIYNFNWAYYLQSLKEYCEMGKGKPFSV